MYKFLFFVSIAINYLYFFLKYTNSKLEKDSIQRIKIIECLLTIESINMPEI